MFNEFINTAFISHSGKTDNGALLNFTTFARYMYAVLI